MKSEEQSGLLAGPFLFGEFFQQPYFAQQSLGGIGRFGTAAQPGEGFGFVNAQLPRLGNGVVNAEDVQKTTVAGTAAVSHYQAVKRPLFGAHTTQSDLNCQDFTS